MGYIVCALSQRGHSLVSSSRGFSAAPSRDPLLHLPAKMKTIQLELDESVLELADQLLAQQELPEEPQVVSLFDGEDPPSLHDLFDVSLPVGFPDYSEDVELIFPSAVVDQVELENSSSQEEFRCETPVVGVDLFSSESETQRALFSSEEVDLTCAESMISTSPESSVGSPEEAEPEAGPSSRWGPLEPGDSPRPCRACTYHKIESGDPLLKCSLCYMQETYHQVYSKLISSFLFLLERLCVCLRAESEYFSCIF